MKDNSGRKLALWGAWLQLGLALGLVMTVLSMIRAFERAAAYEPGSAELLPDDISVAPITTAIGVIPGFVGLVLMGIALFGKKYRAPGSSGS